MVLSTLDCAVTTYDGANGTRSRCGFRDPVRMLIQGGVDMCQASVVFSYVLLPCAKGIEFAGSLSAFGCFS